MNKLQKSYTRPVLLGALAGIGLALVFCAGFLLRDIMDMPSVFATSTDPSAEGYPLLDEVQILLDQYYLRDQPDYTTRQYAAIRGLVSQLGDRNTFFIEPPVAQSESDVLAGTYGGIGVNLQRNADGDFVIYPFEDGPAAREGVLSGDILKAVNGVAIAPGDPPDQVDQALRGEVKDGNGVEITVLREDEELEFFILFDVINVPSVQWRALTEDERIGYIQILRFTSRTPDEINEALGELTESGVEALVLDLRQNYGGLLQESIDVASIFLEDGDVLRELSISGERTYTTSSVEINNDLPLVVLVDRGTASASELLAGAIQDRGRGILIGQVTYGKGTIQQIFRLSDNSSIHITSAEWFTPAGNAIDGVGLTPDIVMIPDEAGRDVELAEAVRHLRDEVLNQ